MECKDNDYPLSVFLKDYNNGFLSKRLLEEKIIKYVLDHYRIYMPIKSGSKDDFADFICWLYPRLSKTIFRYKEEGASFEAFIYTYITYGYREYLALQKAKYFCKDYDLNQNVESLAVSEPQLNYENDHTTDENILYNSFFNTKYILILLLKSYFYVSDNFVSKVAINLGIEREILNDFIDSLHVIRNKKEVRFNQLNERITRQYFLCIYYEKMIPHYDKNSKRYDKLNQLLTRGRSRLINMRSRIKRIRLDATNEEVASVLGVPKGTVDSILSKYKKKEVFSKNFKNVCMDSLTKI